MQPEEDITNKLYFFSNFRNTNEVAEFLKLKSGSKQGSYLLRPSFRNPQNFTVSVVVKDKSVRHTNIIVEQNGHHKLYYLVKEKKFPSIQSLLDFYETNDVKNLEKVNHVRFLHPIKRNTRRNPDSYSDTSSNSSIHYPSGPYDDGNVRNDSAGSRPPLPERPPLPRRPSASNSSTTTGSQMSLSGGHHVFPSQSSFDQEFPETFLHDGAAGNRAIDRRPPAPLPVTHEMKDHSPYYSTPRNVEEDISERLKEVLKANERCDCGIPRDMSDLPLGWTVHRSKDPGTFGRLFFQSVNGVTTWKIPIEVQQKMTPKQTHNIKTLIHGGDNLSSSNSYLVSSSNNNQRSSGSQFSDRSYDARGHNLQTEESVGLQVRQPSVNSLGRPMQAGQPLNTQF